MKINLKLMKSFFPMEFCYFISKSPKQAEGFQPRQKLTEKREKVT